MSLRTRLFALVSAAVAVAVFLATWTVSASARRSFAALDAQRTAALVAQFRREFAIEGEEVAVRVERVAGSEALLRTAADLGRSPGDAAALVNEAAPLAAAQGLDFLDLVAADGTILSSAEWPAKFGYPHPWALTAGTAARAAFLQPVELPRDIALGLVAVRQVKTADRPLYVAGGRRLDQQFLRTLVLPEGMRVLLYRNVEPELSRQQLIDATGEVPHAAQLEPLIARVRQNREEAVETVRWPDGPETITAVPLSGRGGTVLGVLLVGSSGRELAALVNRIYWSGLAFGGLGVVVGFILSYLIAARVTRPVEQLAEAAHAVAAGDWNVRLDEVSSSGEIEALARSFEAMTRQLLDQRERLLQAERVAAWRELARRLAHELKNPLFPLRITIDNLRRAKALQPAEFDEVFEESVTTLTTGLTNLTTVIARFSDFAKMPAPELTTLSPNDVVEQSLQLFRAQLEAPERPPIKVATDLDPSVGTIRADPEQLGRALQNLLLNAIDAMPHGGQLTVRTRRAPGAVHLEVSDTGEGLTEEERRRLFTPYYTTKQHGTGLGLAIVQSVVADHAGKVTVESEPGRGTTFLIELPS
ncbi:MAG TPA: ATP-binding protein [Vicinamibacterales bacterium]|nr:ATP-binding protein [Vicinamibacterales bacterium]